MALKSGNKGKVYAFEPTVFAFEKLRANLALNPELGKRIKTQHMLLNDGQSSAPKALPSSWNLSTKRSTETHPKHGGTDKSLGDVKTSSLDTFIEENKITRVDLIKLDVDGNEWTVLLGAKKTLQSHSPTILMEFAPDYDPKAFDEILKMFRNLGYSAYSLNERHQLPLTSEELRRMIPKDGSINVMLKL
jgi:FkbM family methyltransferase